MIHTCLKNSLYKFWSPKLLNREGEVPNQNWGQTNRPTEFVESSGNYAPKNIIVFTTYYFTYSIENLLTYFLKLSCAYWCDYRLWLGMSDLNYQVIIDYWLHDSVISMTWLVSHSYTGLFCCNILQLISGIIGSFFKIHQYPVSPHIKILAAAFAQNKMVHLCMTQAFNCRWNFDGRWNLYSCNEYCLIWEFETSWLHI